MVTKMLHINELAVTRDPVMYTCYGLGSCIGLFISDRSKQLSAGAHIPLPSEVMGDYRSADNMIDEVMEHLNQLGSMPGYLRAKVTGGATVFDAHIGLGKQNIKAVIEQLVRRRIYIVASDVGGTVSRTARYNSVTGELLISTSDRKTYFI